MPYSYEVYNQRICSEVPIRPLQQINSTAEHCDISITLGRTPKALRQPSVFSNVCTSIAPNEFLLYHKALGVRIYIENANKIIIDNSFETDVDKVSLFLLGTILAAAMYMRNIIPMHASAVNTPKGTVLVLGKSGAGKSTLAHGLHQRGYSAVTDDVAYINITENIPYTYAGYNSFKLWQESLDFHKKDTNNYPLIRDSYNKYYVSFNQEAEKKKYKIHKIYCLKTHNKSELQISKIENKSESFKVLKENTYRPNYVTGLEKEVEQFYTITKLAHIPLSIITRPQNLTTQFDDYIGTIEKDILQ